MEKTTKKIIDFIEENDYEHRIRIMNHAHAIEWLEEVNDANGITETAEEHFGETISESSIVLYALPQNGDGKYFVYTPGRYQHFYHIAEDAYEHAYNKRMAIPNEYCN